MWCSVIKKKVYFGLIIIVVFLSLLSETVLNINYKIFCVVNINRFFFAPATLSAIQSIQHMLSTSAVYFAANKIVAMHTIKC